MVFMIFCVNKRKDNVLIANAENGLKQNRLIQKSFVPVNVQHE